MFDIPDELALEVIEHVASLRRCQSCGVVNAGSFLDSACAPVRSLDDEALAELHA
jgi:hypothetical protein